MNTSPTISRALPWLALFLTALVLRLLAVAILHAPADEPRAYEHGEIAHHLIAGEGFRVRFLGVERFTSQQAPFYPYLLAGFYLVFGEGTSAELAVQVLQCFTGAALCLAVVALTRAVLPASPSAAWCAGWGAAIYPPHVYMVTHLQVAHWAALWLTLLAAWTLSVDVTRPVRNGIVAGLLAALLLLTEPILALALPILAIALWRRTRAERAYSATNLFSGMKPSIVMTLVTCAAIAPWLVRNYRVHGELVFIKSTFGYAFWQANNAASFGTDKVPMPDADVSAAEHDGSLASMNKALWAARYETMYIDDLLFTPEDDARFRKLSETECCRDLQARANKFIAENPGRYAKLCLNRLRFFLLWDETNPKAKHPIYQLSTLAWLALGTIGLAVTRGSWRTLWPTYAIFFTILLFHTFTITSARFRVPLEPLTFPWCAGTVSALTHRVRR